MLDATELLTSKLCNMFEDLKHKIMVPLFRYILSIYSSDDGILKHKSCRFQFFNNTHIGHELLGLTIYIILLFRG